VHHEIRPGFGASVAYFRTSYNNLTVIDNRAFSPADYSQYCVTAPVDPRLGSVTGSQICGLYDVSPTKFGQVNELVTHASNFGDMTDVFNGVDVNVNARFGRGGTLTGGVGTGTRVKDRCFIVDSPGELRFCRVTNPWSSLTQVKLAGTYPLPWDFQVSGTFQNLSGPSIDANRSYTSAQIAPSLGRPLAAGSGATVSIPLVEPNTLYESRFNQLDFRVTRTFRFSTSRIQAQFDMYNALNGSAILTVNNTYGSTWQAARTMLAARMVKFGVQIDFN
jgi:hypothetical protein